MAKQGEKSMEDEMAKHAKHKAGVFKGGVNPRLVSENKRSPRPKKKLARKK